MISRILREISHSTLFGLRSPCTKGISVPRKPLRLPSFSSSGTSIAKRSACKVPSGGFVLRTFILFLGVSIPVFAATPHREKSAAQSHKTDSTNARIEKYLTEYPELRYLLDGTEKWQTNEGSDVVGGVDQSYPKEFKRAIACLDFLGKILEGSEIAHATLVAAQREDVRLSFDTFSRLHTRINAFLDSGLKGLSREELKDLIYVLATMGDLGKSGVLRELFPHIKDEDHDKFVGKMLYALKEDPSILPSYHRLSPAAQEIVQMPVPLHPGHGSHIEGGPGMFTALKESGIAAKHPWAIDLLEVLHCVDVMGAAGHVNPNSSLAFTEPCAKRIGYLFSSVRKFSDAAATEKTVLADYLKQMSTSLGFQGTTKEEQTLARLGCMLRFYGPKDGALLAKAFAKLSPEKQADLVRSFHPFTCWPFETPTYVPAVLINASNSSKWGGSPEERIDAIFQNLLPFIASIEVGYAKGVEEGKYATQDPLCFNSLAGVVRNQVVSLESSSWYIDKRMHPQVYPS